MAKRILTEDERHKTHMETMKAELIAHPEANISVFIRRETVESGQPIAEVKRKFITRIPQDRHV